MSASLGWGSFSLFAFVGFKAERRVKRIGKMIMDEKVVSMGDCHFLLPGQCDKFAISCTVTGA